MIDWHGSIIIDDRCARRTKFSWLYSNQLAPMPGAAELLTALETAGVPKAIATSSRRAFAQDLLGRVQWRERFDFILGAEDVTQGKPHPEIYLTAARRLGAEPPQMAVLEDSQAGCRAAVAAGAVAVAVPGGHSRRHCFDGATLCADTLADPRLYQLLGVPPAGESRVRASG